MCDAVSNRRTSFATAFAVLSASAGLLAALSWPAWFGAVYLTDDLSAFHLPLRAFYAQCLRVGEDHRWCPLVHCGFDLHGEGQVGMRHPWHFILYRLLPTPLAFNLELLACFPFFFVGMFWWLRRRLHTDAALLGAMLAAFGGVTLLRAVHLNALAIVAHIPWQLWAVERMLRPRPHEWYGVGPAAFSLALGSQLSLGYPQYVWFSAVALAVYLTILSIVDRETRAVRGVRTVVGIGCATTIGVLLGAGQLLPTAQALALSERASTDREFRGERSLPPANLLQPFAPYATTGRAFTDDPQNPSLTLEYGAYFGALAVALAVVGCRPPSPALRALVAFGLAMVVLGTVLALGRYTPLFEVTSRLPLVAAFRAPCRATVLVQLGIAALAAVGWQRIVEGGVRPFAYCIPPLLAFGVAFVGVEGMPHVEQSDAVARWYAPAAFGVLGLLLALLGRGYAAAGVAAVIVGAGDIGWYGVTFLRSMPPDRPNLEIPQASPEGRFWMAEHGLGPILRGHRLANGYVGLPPARRLDYSTPAALSAAGVRFRIEGNPPRFAPLPEPLPRASVAHAAVVFPKDSRVDLSGLDLQRQAAVDRTIQLDDVGEERGGAAVVRDSPGDVTIMTVSPGRALLVLNESWHPGWTATVGGESVAVLRANGDFLGVVVERGRCEVRFVFRPRAAEIGSWLSWLGAVLVVALALYRSRLAE